MAISRTQETKTHVVLIGMLDVDVENNRVNKVDNGRCAYVDNAGLLVDNLLIFSPPMRKRTR